jgi:ApbE superfamily uncharacterized protein (UPF0280 family)
VYKKWRVKIMYRKRVYRNSYKGVNLQFFDVCVYETDLKVGACSDLYEEALKSVIKYRGQIENYIKINPGFAASLEPIEIGKETASKNIPYIVERMIRVSKKAGVGPMAAVAGAISEMVGKELLKYSKEIIIENGGDLFIKTDVERKVGIYAGNSYLSEKVALKIYPEKTPLGVCTSSGTVGHALSFGKADAAVVLSKDVFLADALATAVGNKVKETNDIEKAIEFASKIEGIEGVLIIVNNSIGLWGDIEITKI